MMDENELTENEWMDRLDAAELAKLTPEQRREVEAAIEVCRKTNKPAGWTVGDGDVYAYPRSGKGVAWGINAPLNIARAIRPDK